MSRRVLAFVVVCVLALGGATAYALGDLARHRDRLASAPAPAQTEAATIAHGPRVLFRNTVIGPDYGLVAMVALDDASGPRAITDLSCERIDAVAAGASCLRSDRGVVTRHAWVDLDQDLSPIAEQPLAGVPSRTRLSGDGSLVASTVFVSGHSYMQAGFSTATVVRERDGVSHGNLERFSLLRDGEEISPRDLNVWGVTFAGGDEFYATAATGGTAYLVRGDLGDRTLTTVRSGAECPSLSPDGSRVAYKVDVGNGETRWALAVLDLGSGRETVLDPFARTADRASIDDQVEWLDGDTLLFGLPRLREPGVTDVWALDVDPDAQARVLIENAWSPAVVDEDEQGGGSGAPPG